IVTCMMKLTSQRFRSRPRLLSYILLSSRSPTPRALPSFPTRRSSDLGVGSPGRGRREVEPVDPDVVLIPGHFGLADPERQDRSEDRKSTRLNSSHVKISYAVFCLKKKK